MDNVTHSLAGWLVAEAALAMRARSPSPRTPSRGFRTTLVATSIVANNLPDLDFLYRGITPGKLGYLLHHRGHTHTVPGALALGVLAIAVAFGASRWRRAAFLPADRRTLVALALLGPLLHITMDFQNSYGVHPFWPLYDGWFYGDSIFIVEPLLFAVALPVLIFLAESRLVRGLLGVLLAAIVVAGATRRFVPLGSAIAISVLAAGATFVASRCRPGARAFVGIAGWLAITLTFIVAGKVASRLVRASSASFFPTTTVVDEVRTPMPANPLCWSIWVLGTAGGDYVARKAVVSVWPGVLSSERCAALERNAPIASPPTKITADHAVAWYSTFARPVSELRDLPRANCTAAAFLRFARAPFWTPPGSGWRTVGDLRFRGNRGFGFAEVAAGAGPCPKNVPPWTPPRADLLR